MVFPPIVFCCELAEVDLITVNIGELCSIGSGHV